MLPHLNGTTEGYLDNLDRIRAAMDTIQRQVSSGVRVGRASDDPSAVSSILGTQSQIDTANQVLTNFKQLKTELETGDHFKRGEILGQPIGMATAGASDLEPARYDARPAAQALQRQLVDLAAHP
jgi:hypothetical protein